MSAAELLLLLLLAADFHVYCTSTTSPDFDLVLLT